MVQAVAFGQLLYVHKEQTHLFALLLLLEGKVEAEALDSAGETPLAELFPPDELVLLTVSNACVWCLNLAMVDLGMTSHGLGQPHNVHLAEKVQLR